MKVSAPWTPIEFQMQGNYVRVGIWGREYVWNNSLLPVSMNTAHQELLAAPASLHAFFAGVEQPFVNTELLLISRDEAKVVFTVSQTAGNIIVNARFTLAYDGFVEWALSVIPFWQFSPDHQNVARLDGLYFEFPLHRQCASLFHFWPNGDSGIIPDQRIMASGAVPAAGLNCSFKPYVWAGWEFGGLSLCTETDENIQLKPGTPCIQFSNSGGETALRWNLLDKAPRQWAGRADRWVEALEPIDYIFGFQATPVKELDPNRMDTRIFHHGYHNDDDILATDPQTGGNLLDTLQQAGINWIIFHEAWSAIQNYGYAAEEGKFRNYVAECHKRNIKVMAYFGYEYSTLAPDWHEKKDAFLVKTPDGHFTGGWQRQPAQRAYMACYQGGYAGGLRERVAYAMDHYQLDGIYTDGTYVPWECANAVHGCGYGDEHGQRHVTFPIFAVRRHVQALYELVHERGGLIDTHQSSCLMAPVLGFTDIYYNGESIQTKLKEDFLDFLNLEAFRTEYMGKNIGIPAQFLATIDDRLPIEKITSLTIVHDVLPRPCDKESIGYLARIWTIFHDFGTGRAAWYPYWQEGSPVASRTPDVCCSVYEREGQYLAVVAGFFTEPGQVVLKLARPARNVSVRLGNAAPVLSETEIAFTIKPCEAVILEIS